MLYVTFIDPKDKKERTTQIVRPLVIGRSKGADVNVEGDSTVSRLHALIAPRLDGRLDIRDLASSAGTHIMRLGQKMRLLPEPNNAEKGRAVLFDGELFLIGRVEFKVHYKELIGEPTLPHDYAEEMNEEITEEIAMEDTI
ncbi:MAG: FHA domain-containing protein [Deltaproteobacteria bacterium]|nr:FHA domain-containing protein [Deltaproteobacteria bacterium]MBI2975135.1 FHA domain-containing protein [Deltaproteobacteria bacterium]